LTTCRRISDFQCATDRITALWEISIAGARISTVSRLPGCCWWLADRVVVGVAWRGSEPVYAYISGGNQGLIDVLSDHWSNYDQYNKGKYITLAASTKNFFEQDIPPLQNPRSHTIPPWHYKELNVDTFLSKLFTKDDTDPHIIKNTCLGYLEYLENFSKNLLIFTDGSKDSNHSTGFAYTIPSLNINYQERLPTYASVFTSELLAIRAALKYIKLQELKKQQHPFSSL
jgi:hypothetical protein